jgi:hypothetical protein
MNLDGQSRHLIRGKSITLKDAISIKTRVSLGLLGQSLKWIGLKTQGVLRDFRRSTSTYRVGFN